MTDLAAVCPECRQGKCQNCTITTLDLTIDDFVRCVCAHGQPEAAAEAARSALDEAAVAAGLAERKSTMTFDIDAVDSVVLKVMGDGGRALLTLHRDGRLVLDVNDAPEAAQAFADHVSRILTQRPEPEVVSVDLSSTVDRVGRLGL